MVLSIKQKLMLVLSGLLFMMILTGIILVNYLTSEALNAQLEASIKSSITTAAGAARTGLEFEDNDSVADALKPFTEDEQVAYIEVKNIRNESVYYYRKKGWAKISNVFKAEITESGKEVFISQEITSGNEKIGAVALGISLSIRNEALSYAQNTLFTLAVAGLLILIATIYILANSISKPIRKLVEVADSVSEGELEQSINLSGSAEVESLANGFQSMLNYIKEIAYLADNVSKGDLTSNVNIRSLNDVLSLSFDKLMRQLKDIFTDINSYTSQLSLASNGLKSMSDTLSSSSENLNQVSNTISTSTEHQQENISAISTSAQEMKSTVSEIAQNAEKTRVITEDAVHSTEKANQQMTELNQASKEINKVIEVIVDIAEQIKLLALNATIEAARAGEAGRGFAVVANEVKDLAHQTNNATEDINKRLHKMQETTNHAVSSISQVASVIGEVNSMVSMIAASVEEQNVTVADIAQNIQKDAFASESIVKEMSHFTESSQTVKTNSIELQKNAVGLQTINKKLSGIVKKFRLEEN
jgi:methyl-accepting chemotaxis protein